MKRQKINSLHPPEHPFTSVLSVIDQPPAILYARGTVPESRLPTVAFIGSRRPTHYGLAVTRQLAGQLARRGVVILSGLAFGIDVAAHQAALEVEGVTIAVLANGLHKTYPQSHQVIGEQIVSSGGALLSEYPPGTEPRRYHFLARNRLISGLADIIIVIEATGHSGTTSTVAHAILQNKEIAAIPGPITSPLSTGPNRLLQQGAHLITEVQDITDLLGLPADDPRPSALPRAHNETQAAILGALANGPLDADELLRHLSHETAKGLEALTMLELQGAIRHLGANRWALV